MNRPRSSPLGVLPAAAVFYAGFYGSYGVAIPYLPTYLQGRGVEPEAAGVLLALAPLATCVVPVVVGRWADRHARPALALRATVVGSLLGWAVLGLIDGTPGLWLGMALVALAQCSSVPLVDAITMRLAVECGGDYGRTRLVGSIAFVLAAVGGGQALERGLLGAGALLLPIAAGTALSLFGALGLRDDGPIPNGRRGPVATDTQPDRRPVAPTLATHGLRALLDAPGRVGLLAAAALHWVSLAPYNTAFARHVETLGLGPDVVGVAMGVGATAEILAFVASAPLVGGSGHQGWVRPQVAVGGAIAATAARFVATGLATRADVLIALQALHGLSFGLFYVAALAELHRGADPRARATLQGLFVAVVFGLGGGVGMIGCGFVVAAFGTRAAFVAAAAPSLAALALHAAATRRAARSNSAP
jgi:PPP family 3-phenylpropionic acid transporter